MQLILEINLFSEKYTCGKCGKVYLKKISCYIHQKIDCGTEWLNCIYEGCPFRSKRKYNLNKHIRNVHQSAELLN